jgi:aminoglycoside phosphotransferase (APT) family kinase protein
LLAAECPELAEDPIRLVDEGWDNFTFLVGQRYAARLPRREVAVPLLVNEQRWLPVLAPRLSLEVPVPVYVGQPSALFPWPWSVVHWIQGKTAETHVFHSADTTLLARVLRALHQPAPGDAPRNPFRGVPLSTKSEMVEERIQRFERRPEVDPSRLAAIWRDACAVPGAELRVWVHGDLHPRNVVVRDGALVGLIDWGDVHGGDAATDVASAWMLIATARHRREFLDAYGAGEALVCRAKGWAVHLGLALVASGEPRHTQLGFNTLERVLADS